MVTKLATAVFVAGIAIAPAAAYAAGTSTMSPDATHATKTDARPTGAKAAVTDAAITTKVKAKFAADSAVSATNIHVDTDNGVVKLSGTAKSQEEARKAAEIAKSTEGVSSVDNAIQVSASGAKY